MGLILSLAMRRSNFRFPPKSPRAVLSHSPHNVPTKQEDTAEVEEEGAVMARKLKQRQQQQAAPIIREDDGGDGDDDAAELAAGK